MVMRRELMAGDRDDAVWEFDDVLLVIPKKHHQIKTLNPPPPLSRIISGPQSSRL